MIANQKVLLMFNKCFISFLKDIKSNSMETVKNAIKAKYKLIDKLSTEHVETFWDACEPNMSTFVSLSTEELSVNKDVTTSCSKIFGVPISDILCQFSSLQQKEMFWNHFIILLIFAYMYNDNLHTQNATIDEEGEGEEEEEEEEENSSSDNQILALFQKVTDVISVKQRGGQTDLDDIMDDDIRLLLQKIVKQTGKDDEEEGKKEGKPKGFDIGDVFGNIAKDSKIANLAKEISDEIDISSFKIEKPEDIMKMMDFSNSNSVMGDIIKKVSSKISNKIEKGELGQDELLGEAMSMMSMLGKSGGGGGLGSFLNNPLMNEVMKAMKKGKPMQTRTDVVNKASTRDRLKKKLDDRRT